MPQQNTFSNQPNIICKNTEFTKFTKIFDDSFYRYGVITQYMNTNISLKSSILYCTDINYHAMTAECINTTLYSTDISVLSVQLELNIAIFDFKNNIIKCDYSGDFFNPWKPTIYLANYDEWWEPIVTKDTKIFSFSSLKANILKNNILSQDILRNNTNDAISINDNFNEIIELECFSIVNNETFIAPEKMSRNKLDKMKKDELVILCNNLNKIIATSKPTKKDLINLICE